MPTIGGLYEDETSYLTTLTVKNFFLISICKCELIINDRILGFRKKQKQLRGLTC